MKQSALLFALLLMSINLIAQPAPQGNALQSAKQRVAILSGQLRYHDPAQADSYLSSRDNNTRGLQQELDAYITTGFTPGTAQSEIIGAALSELLSNQPVDPEHSGKAFTSIADLRFGKSLIVAYTLARGGEAVNDSSVTIRGYKDVGGKFQLTDTAKAELDGYGLFTHALASPVSGETWLFVWGPQFGFNGTKVRLRILAFDGAAFRTVWAPDDVYDANVRFSSSGFTVEHLDMQRLHEFRSPPYRLRDEFILTVTGPQRQSSAFLPE